MQLWQLDIVGGIRLADGSEVKLVSGIDDHSRYCVIAALVVRATARAVCRVFTQAMACHGVPEELLSDIQSRWSPWCLVRSAGRGHALRDRRPSAAVA
jgi:hypothetical protein